VAFNLLKSGWSLTLVFIFAFYISMMFAIEVFPFTIQKGLRNKFDEDTTGGAIAISLCEENVNICFSTRTPPAGQSRFPSVRKMLIFVSRRGHDRRGDRDFPL
jgi:hypothetical protein